MDTVPPHKYGSLVWQPRGSLSKASGGNIGKIRFDKDHYYRAYTLCRGRGLSEEECWGKLPPDMHVTPQNPLPTLYKKELVDATECMSDYGDLKKCNHFLEVFHKKANSENNVKPPGKFDKISGAVTLLGASTMPLLALTAALRVIKIKL